MTQGVQATAVTPAVVRSMIDRALAGNYATGVIGVRAQPGATRESEFTYRQQPVRVVPAVSALAVREALRHAPEDGWLVVVTDRPDEDLGAGLLSRITWHRLRHPDPWDALQQQFAAQAVDARLLRLGGARELAAGLLELTPAAGWPPAPAGVLTPEHALGALARSELELPRGPLDLVTVLNWSISPELPLLLAGLRSRGGDAVTDAVLKWIAEASGEAEPLVTAMLRRGTPIDLVPIGVVLDCLLRADDQRAAEVALARLEHRWGGDVPRGALTAAGRLSAVVASGLLGGTGTQRDALRLLARADELLTAAQAETLAVASTLLRSGLTLRLRAMAEELRRAPGGDRARLDAAWERVGEHLLAGQDPRVAPSAAAVRLARWLAVEDPGGGLADLAARYLAVEAWTDSAVNDAASGVDDEGLAAAIEHVLAEVRHRRDGQDARFAAALAAEGADRTPDGVLGLEDVLGEVVVPLAKRTPTLLLVLDGMSAAVATEIMADVTESLELGLVEYLPPGAEHRMAALAVLPSVTEFSRTSLLSGRLVGGSQADERKNLAAYADARGLGAVALFHKGGLEASRQGFALADAVRQAIADVEGRRLVACVLNTIDDAMDRTDPGGTDWTADAVKHLRPLLAAARDAGRVVVVTSDHGHVVERRQGTQRGNATAARWRDATGAGAAGAACAVGAAGDARDARGAGAAGGAVGAGLAGGSRTTTRGDTGRGARDARPADGGVGADEVLVEGRRVLANGNRAVLAVDERLRYTGIRAGYHGGAAPAEVVVPVLVLAEPNEPKAKLIPAGTVQPAWWDPDVVASTAPTLPEVARPALKARPVIQPDLFDEPAEPETAPAPPPTAGPGATVVASKAYAAQQKMAGRVDLSDETIARLIDGLAAAPGQRLPTPKVAVLIGSSNSRVRMAISQVAKLLNVEGYPVVTLDPRTQTVTLNTPLLEEQFGVGG